ncbi:MAG: GAF domain-containing protein, partial [Bdellovibrionaceae bacterium]|nr:GAF domain-containing protein [Pseudobdellovibrionaceae bacterium]
MQDQERFARVLTNGLESISLASSLSSITKTITNVAREIARSDGTTFVLREEGQCYYVDEDAISPLWKGKKFPVEACVSGYAMLNKEIVIIPNIYRDSRVPQDAYLPTFVKSMCMIPIRVEAPVGAIGVYWANHYEPSADEIRVLQIVANASAIALENLELRNA